MSIAKEIGLHADYDLVGKYQQDDINGFDQSIIEEMFELGEAYSANRILDAMAGDGNLTSSLLAQFSRRGLPSPKVSLLEYSSVQCDVARARQELTSADIIWGDILKLSSRATNQPIQKASFDRVFIKSASHEIPADQQLTMYSNVCELLEDGGLFVNLGFLFDSSDERDEFREIARSKDTLAGLATMAENRHFLTRHEFNALLREAGFDTPTKARPLTYLIKSWIVAEHYFAASEREQAELDFQAAQAQARHLRKAGKIIFHGDRTSMYIPGEITVARKKQINEHIGDIYEKYPYEFLENIRAHKELMNKVESMIGRNSLVLDLGCGPGILFSRIQNKVANYVGVDSSPQFIARCNQKKSDQSNASFVNADINQFDPTPGSYDAVVLTNVLYQDKVDPNAVLRRAIAALRPGGKLVVSGPTSPNSFQDAARQMELDLQEDGFLPEYSSIFQEICRANERLLVERGHYWSVEGMVELLLQLGASSIDVADNDVFYRNAYLVVASYS